MLEWKEFELGDKQRWFVGNRPEALIFANDTWVKWGVHRSNEQSEPSGWNSVSGHQVSILIEGKITVWVKRPDSSDDKGEPVELTQKGKCVAIPDGWDHKWCVPDIGKDLTLVITVRWKPDLLDVSRDMHALFQAQQKPAGDAG